MSLVIASEKRDAFGKNASYRIRRTGTHPGHPLRRGRTKRRRSSWTKKDVIQILKSELGLNTLFKIAFGSEERDVMIKDVQIDPVTDEVLHADLIQIDMDQGHPRRGPGRARRRGHRRQDRGRIHRLHDPRADHRMSARPHPGAFRRGRHRPAPAPVGQGRRRGRARGHQADHRARRRHRPGPDAAEEKVEVAAAVEEGAEAAPAEPEVIKKERAEKEEPRRRSESCGPSWVWAIPAAATRRRGITWASSSSSGWPRTGERACASRASWPRRARSAATESASSWPCRRPS